MAGRERTAAELPGDLGARDIDGQLLAVARGTMGAAGAKLGRRRRRRRRRAERGFHAARAAAVPVAVAGAALRLLGERRDAGREPLAAEPSTGWVPAALAAPERVAPLRTAGPADWLPSALRAANGSVAPAAPVLRVAPTEREIS